MFTVKLDRTDNTLTILYAREVTRDEIRLCADEVTLALTILQPRFRLIVDLTELQSMDIACSPLIANIMEICNAAGVAEVVRIIPDPTRDIGLQIMSYFHYGGDVRIRTCQSLSDAALALPALNAED
jgi:anti-anti-sigma regulatory factor